MKENETAKQRPVAESWEALINVIKSANKLVPGCSVVGVLLAALVIVVAITSVKVMAGIIVLVVLISAVVVYSQTRNYGEAALALVAGLLTAFTVTWTPGRFAAFLVAWIMFSLVALLISTVRMSADVQSIYTQAAISISTDPVESEKIRKQLESIGNKGTPNNQLKPVQRAEVIRLLVFRKIPIDSLEEALRVIEMVSVVTKVDPKTTTLFIVAVLKILEVRSTSEYSKLLDQIMGYIRESAVTPEDYIRACELSRSLALSGRVPVERYFELVKHFLEMGYAPDDVSNAIIDQINHGASWAS